MIIYAQILLGVQAFSALLSLTAFTIGSVTERNRHSAEFRLSCVGLALWTPIVGRLAGWW